MSSIWQRKLLLLCAGGLLSAALVLAGILGTATTQAKPRSRPAVVVSMGDSMISGVAGRWKGNSLSDSGSKDGTDRACVPGTDPGTCSSYDIDKVYVDGTAEDQCLRSDVAEVLSARIPAMHGINVACGGAPINSLLTTAQGGKRFKDEPPQGNRLATIAREDRIRIIVIDMGANNTDFGDVITSCAESYVGLGPEKTCAADEAAFTKEIPAVTRRLERGVHDVRETMKARGYHANDYRLVLQDYAIGFPPGSQVRYPQAAVKERFDDGCPYSNADLDWINDVGVRLLTSMVRDAAKHARAEFLDIGSVLDRHQVCSIHDRLVTSRNPPSAKTSEWTRFFSYEHVIAQGPPESADDYLGEIAHPNYYGQLAFGACLTQAAASPAGQHTCTTIKGSSTTQLLTTTSGRGTCPSTTHPTYRLTQPAGGRITTERVYRNGRLWRTFRGTRLTRVSLPPVTASDFTLKLQEQTTNHLEIVTTLTYHGCRS